MNTIKSSVKGWLGEKLPQFALWLALDKEEYPRFHDTIVPDEGGETTQIDHIVVSRYAVFVVETKNMKGWIFGSERDKQWTQSLTGGKKFRFQNPLRQNYRHIKCLSGFLGLPESAFESVVFFVPDECVFKTEMPENVMNRGLIKYIKNFQTPRLSAEQVWEICGKLHGLKEDPTLNHRAHLRSLEERHARPPASAARRAPAKEIHAAKETNDEKSTQPCPKCGAALVMRTAGKGARSGSKFWGCTSYPKCRYIINIQ
ncbi:MAG: NERD domain-containing protein [Gammaproteobacteria bacterium]